MSTEVVPAKRKKLAIIDGKSVFYRGYYAMPNLSTKDGIPTGGVFGFASMALEVLKKLKPDYVCVAWDKPKTNIRRRLELYPEYKAGRKPAPPDFYEQIPILHELLDAFGWPLYELDDYEADDIMGTLAVKATEQDIETMLVTSDLDVLQMVDDHVHAFTLKKGLSSIELYSPKSFTAKYGLESSQFLDLKALKGDSSDNIPGVPGIGEKTAIELLKSYKTLDGIYENIDLLKESVRKKLVAGKELAYLSKELAAIWTDAPVELDLENLDVANCEPEKVREVLQRLEFRSLLRQLPEVMQVAAHEEVAAIQASGLELAKLSVASSPADLERITTKTFFYLLGQYDDPLGRNLRQLAIADEKGKGVILTGEQLAKRTYQKVLAAQAGRFFSKTVVSHDSKALIRHFLSWGYTGAVHTLFDVQVAGFFLNALIRDQSLAALAREWLNLEIEAEEMEEGDRLKLHVAVLHKLHTLLSKELAKPEYKQLAHLFQTVEMPVIPVIAAMEHEGIRLNTGYLKKMSKEIDEMIADLENKIYAEAGKEFNISSPGQLADVLFNTLKLPTAGIKRGKTGYSTAASELDKLRSSHAIIDLITHYREVTKLKNTYVDTLPTMVDENSRVHTVFNMTIAATGRLSSVDPNLQNIPVRSELGKRIRTAFEAEKGNVFVSADYSQFELRLAAHLSGDERLIDQFNRDVDVHTTTAAEVYGREPEDVTKNMRRDAKVVNFGVMYGLSTHGLVQATGLTYEQAKHFIDRYFEVRPKLLAYIESVKQQARDAGYVETIMGRRRPTPDVKSGNFAVREAAIRAAVNMPFQGSAADIMKLAMVKVHEKLAGTKCKMLLQIHDSVLVECPEAEAEETAKLLKETMESAYKLPVKLTVETAIGKNWGEL